MYLVEVSQKFSKSKEKIFLRLGKILYSKTERRRSFFINTLLLGKKFEQFSCRQKTPQKSRKSYNLGFQFFFQSKLLKQQSNVSQEARIVKKKKPVIVE